MKYEKKRKRKEGSLKDWLKQSKLKHWNARAELVHGAGTQAPERCDLNKRAVLVESLKKKRKKRKAFLLITGADGQAHTRTHTKREQ